MPRLTLKNCSSNRYLSLHPQYLKVGKKIRKKLRESQILTPSMEIRSPILSQITLHLAISLLQAILTISSCQIIDS
jgi:hypothetical protein